MVVKKNYPTASLENCIELAESVNKLGGECTPQACAENMDRKVSGAFSLIIRTSTKFGLTEYKSGKLKVTELYKKYKHAYTPEEEKSLLKEAIFNISIFKELYERFKDLELPIKMIDKILVREYNVDVKYGKRVAKYFVDSLRKAGLLKEDNTFEVDETKDITEEKNKPAEKLQPEAESTQRELTDITQVYKVSFIGPGINTNFELTEKEDFDIVDAFIKKIRKKVEKK